MKELISVAEARDIVLDCTPTGGTEGARLEHAVGRVLRAPIKARGDIPPFDNSAMDGYAVRADEVAVTPVEVPVSLDIPAGAAGGGSLLPGTCARIMTGARLPDGADAVVPVEWTSGFSDVGKTVTVLRSPVAGQNIRLAGEDVRAGSQIFAEGVLVRSNMIGTLASLGYPSITAGIRPSISILATGNELVDPADEPGPGEIRNSNGPALSALVTAAGGRLHLASIARDDFDETLSRLRQAAEADMVIISGGVSVGARDFVKEALEELGVELLFWRVRQRPGKPLVFGRLGERLIFGLPGNPVSSTMCFYEYVYPAICRFLGSPTERKLDTAVLTSDLAKPAGLHCFIAGFSHHDEKGLLQVERSGAQGSHIYSAVAASNCIIHLDEELEGPPAVGSRVVIEPLPC